jgi:hypothetical protein
MSFTVNRAFLIVMQNVGVPSVIKLIVMMPSWDIPRSSFCIKFFNYLMLNVIYRE